MAASKKSRKVGRIGVRKDPDYQHTTGPLKKKIGKGHKPGSRHNVEQNTKGTASGKKGGVNDPRHGSKKPVPLVLTHKAVTASERRKFATPAEELAFIEADQRLSKLLDLADADQPLSSDDRAYLEQKLARHRLLCDLIGIRSNTDGETSVDEDLFDKLKPIDQRDFI